jgi:hypothetical protein
LTFPHSPQNISRCFGTCNQNANEKRRKGEENPKEERETIPEMSGEQELAGNARERTINI